VGTPCLGRTRWSASRSTGLSNTTSQASIGRSMRSRTITVETVLRVGQEAGRYTAQTSRVSPITAAGHDHLDSRLRSAYVLRSDTWMPRCAGRDAEHAQFTPRRWFREYAVMARSRRKPSPCQGAALRATFSTAARSPHSAAGPVRRVPRGPPPMPCAPCTALERSRAIQERHRRHEEEGRPLNGLRFPGRWGRVDPKSPSGWRAS
jgi:hypothetical protein